MQLSKQQIWDIGVQPTITNSLHSDNKLYDAADNELFYCSGEQSILFLLPRNDIFGLDAKHIISTETIRIHYLNCAFQEAFDNVILERYKIRYKHLTPHYSESMYYLDSALSIYFKRGETARYITRNTDVLNLLPIVKYNRIYDEGSYLNISDEFIQEQKATVIFAKPTEEGYSLSYEILDMSNTKDYVIVPVVWYQKFMSTLTNILEHSICEISYIDNGVIRNVQGTLCQTTLNSSINIATHYLSENHTHKIGVLQVVCAETHNIYNTDIRTIKRITY